MAHRKLNVLVYTGTGTTAGSVKHAVYTLRRLLNPNYAVIPVTESVLLKEPWAPTCALLVIPGGADLGYCQILNGEGNRRIRNYISKGGSYLGLCAGGYYGSQRCEFEVGNKPMEVIGSRELAFYPGTCRGAAYKGFEYRSEKGARAVSLNVRDDVLADVSKTTVSYFNGGGVFVDAEKFAEEGVEILAEYADDINVDGGTGKAAMVLCKVDSGKALLTGPHPEFSSLLLNPQPEIPGYDKLTETLSEHELSRLSLLKACLKKLGLEVPGSLSEREPSLSALHLSSMDPEKLQDLLCLWNTVMDKEGGKELVKGEVDTFQVQSDDSFSSMDALRKALSLDIATEKSVATTEDLNTVVKKIIAHETNIPDPSLTPQFDHALFYQSLKRYRILEPTARSWGDILLYGETVTSTNSLLEKNPKLTSRTPTGFTFTASTQIAGRGRGTNVWVAPPGSLLFSTVINHPTHLAVSRPIVFIQYLAAIATVEAIRSYGPGYGEIPVKLKWPNDIYALDPNKSSSGREYVKIAGILSHCAYSNGAYQVVLGIGINVNNPRPTTSISDLLPDYSKSSTFSSSNGSPPLAPLHLETLLARILTRFEATYAQFCRDGFSTDLEERYYSHWLHDGQIITLEEEPGVTARVVGITKDWGMLKVEEIDATRMGTGRVWALQSDENSFDYWKGLVKRKV